MGVAWGSNWNITLAAPRPEADLRVDKILHLELASISASNGENACGESNERAEMEMQLADMRQSSLVLFDNL